LRNASRRRWLCALAALAASTVAGVDAVADPLPLREADVRIEDDLVLLNADFELSLNSTLGRRCSAESRSTSCSKSRSRGRAGTGSTRRWRSSRRSTAFRIFR
jgi:hypothetical protein